MKILPIRIIGDPVLRDVADPVGDIDSLPLTLIENMLATMDDVGGVGLAAPQVGVCLRVFTYDDRSGNRGYVMNPELELFEDEEAQGPGEVSPPVREGCLSVPEASGTVKRAGRVRLKGEIFLIPEGTSALTEAKAVNSLDANGLLATIFQHETDHLEGTLFVDRLTGEDRRKAQELLRSTSYESKGATTKASRQESVSSSFVQPLPNTASSLDSGNRLASGKMLGQFGRRP